ncbi:MAG: metallophosphoesterase [Candidatus Krumholzibacteriia bacterium]
MGRTHQGRSRRIAVATILWPLLLLVSGCSSVWPETSDQPVETLDHPTVEERAAELDPPPDAGFRFVVFGDQRAMADGEWQSMIKTIAADFADDDRMLFVMDTGDCVDDGRFSDQWHMLKGILEPISDWPYLVAVGNHEVHDNVYPQAIQNTVKFLARLDEDFGPNRMYYRKDVGPVTFIVLDTNVLAYGPDGRARFVEQPEPGSYAQQQFDWFQEQLEDVPPDRTLVVAMHHPFVQSSRKHMATARGLWNVKIAGRRLPDVLADAGVDLVVVGHTHTYERFRLERDDGRMLHVVNVSGRPRDSFLWFGASERRVQDITGHEQRFFLTRGFENLDRWKIEQVEAMLDTETNQYALVDVEPDGSLRLQVYFLTDGDEMVVHHPPVVLE